MAFRVAQPGSAFALDKSSKATACFKDAQHLVWIRTLPSVISGIYGVQACHIRMGSARHNKPSTGKARKPSDCWVVPMTPDEHLSQHSGSEAAFWKQMGIDPCQVAQELYEATGDTITGIEILRKAR